MRFFVLLLLCGLLCVGVLSQDVNDYDNEDTYDIDLNTQLLQLQQDEPFLIEEEQDFDIEAQEETKQQGMYGAESYLSSLASPPKRRLATREVMLSPMSESVVVNAAPPSPALGELPIQTLPREILSKHHAPRLSLQRLPQKATSVTERRPVKQLPPLQPAKRAPQYRQQIIKQEVIQPVVSVQPMLHQRVLTRTVVQPTMQKQPIIQPIITQPILRREIREQPITQQQMQYQNIVQTRQVSEPTVREELKTKEETAPQQTIESKGAPYPRLTTPPKKHH